MSRINTNVASQLAQRVLGQNNQSLTQSLERLSTGLRVNRGKDDPAGLIASQNLRAELAATNAAITLNAKVESSRQRHKKNFFNAATGMMRYIHCWL